MRPRYLTTMIRAACTLVAAVMLAGCSLLGGGPDVALVFDDPVETKLDDLVKSRQPARLTDLTDFDWDRVHVFYEGAAKDRVEEVVGEPVFKDQNYGSSGSLLVFEKDGRVVRSVAMTGEFIRVDQPTWSSDVMLEPFGQAYLKPVEP